MLYGVLAPLAYAAFLVGSLLIFSKVYRKRQAKQAQREPWFGPHIARDIYVSLLSMDPPPPRKVLIAALIRRAMTDIQRVMEIRENKAALQNLLQKGQIGDDTWNHLLETEKEMDSELYEVVQEANHFRPGWGQYIFPHAGDMIQHEKNKKQFENIDSERKKMAQKYGHGAPLIQPSPILGLVGGKRSLPSSTPSNAQLPGSGPPSKPGTPAPAAAPAAQQAQLQATLQQRVMMEAAQRQHATNLQRNAAANGSNAGSSPAPNPNTAANLTTPQSTPSKGKKASPTGTPVNGKSAASSASTSPAKGVPSSSANAASSSSTAGPNGSSTSVSASVEMHPLSPPTMQRQASTATNESDAEDSDGADDGASSVGTTPGQTPLSTPGLSGGPRKTPKKKNKKKGKKK